MERFIRLSVIVFVITTFFTVGYQVSVYAAQPKTSPMSAPEVHAKKRPASDEYVSGKVVETMNSGGYSYVCLEKGGQKTWVAVPETKVSVGQQMSVLPGMVMPNFTSKSLNRTFDSIIFSGGVAPDHNAGGNKKGKSAKAESMHGSGSAAAASPPSDVKVEKASGPNAYTVGEIYDKRAKLNKKTVMVKARVVKVSSGIMGKNWIHLQDGTGDKQKGSHNLVATSDDTASVGDEVSVKGTVYKDKDFGAGYKYQVILEQATIQH